MIKGITIRLYERVVSGHDGFGHPIYTPEPIEVPNILVEPVSSEDNVSNISLYGKKAVYRLCIPKGDTHDWTDKEVEIFGEKYRVFGFPEEYIEELLPLMWNKKVLVERYG